jgi:hypothetical protein
MNSIRNRIFIVTLCLTAAFIVAFGSKGYSRIETNVPADLSGEETRAIVIEDFESSKIAGSVEEDGWYITSNPKVYTKAKDEETLKKKNPVMALDLKPVDGGPNDMKVEDAFSITGLGKEKKKIMGLKFRFRYPGSNVVTIEAPKEVDWKERTPVMTYDQALRTDVQERGLQIPGRAKAISLWVHGRGFPYTLELWVKGFRGDVHILERQSINFVGWRPMIFDVPQNIPQSSDSYPVTRTAKLVRMVIREVTSVGGEHSRTSARNASDIYVFFDQIKVLTDTYEVYFDGQDMHKAFEGGNSSNQKTQ